MNKQALLIVGVLVVLGVGAYFLFMKPQSQPVTQTETTMTEKEDKTSTSSAMMEAKEFTVESKGLNFTPNEIRVKVGDKVKIIYKNNIGQHNWTLDEFNAKTKLINAGEQDTVEFVADKAGSFEFYCSVAGHRQAGMKGMLIVE